MNYLYYFINKNKRRYFFLILIVIIMAMQTQHLFGLFTALFFEYLSMLLIIFQTYILGKYYMDRKDL